MPTITTGPASQTVTPGQSATFSVVAAGTAPLNYQWAKNGATISGATFSSFTTPVTTASDNGSQFTVVVSNSSGSVTSSPATLTVNSGGLASYCTIFASSSGNDANSGTSATAPKSFNGAAAATQPGSVVCLLAGTYNLSSSFNPPTNGRPSAWIVYKSYGDGAVNFVWTGAADASPMFRLGAGGTTFPTGPSYLEFRGLNFDGGGNAGDALFCRGGHHLRVIGNSMSNTGGSGVGTRDCDYLTADHNTCYKNNLDATLGNAASLTTNNSKNGYFINNIAVAWDTANPTYSAEGTNATISDYGNLYYGSPLNFTPNASAQFVQADPLFVNPPVLTGGQYATALAPSLLGPGLTVLTTSPAIGAGIDPTTLPNLPAEIVNDLRTYVYTDINGKARPQGGSFDLGAYQH